MDFYFKSDDQLAIDFKPRSIHVELLEEAVKGNRIIYLATGSGKNYISTMLIKEKSYGTGKKRTIFLAPNVRSAIQQTKFIEAHSVLNVQCFVDDANSDCDLSSLKTKLSTLQVGIMTPRIFLALITRSYISLSDISLLIIDECHSAVQSGHPYQHIMKKVRECEIENSPHILGLTSSILNRKCNPVKLKEELLLLETIMNSSLISSKDTVTLQCGARAEELVLLYNSLEVQADAEVKKLVNIIESILMDTCAEIFHVVHSQNTEASSNPAAVTQRLLTECLYILHEVGPWGAVTYASILYHEIENNFLTPEYHETFKCYITVALTCFKRIYNNSKPFFDIYGDTLDERWLSSKVRHLCTFLVEYNRRMKSLDTNSKQFELCAILFVERQCVSQILSRILRQLAKQDKEKTELYFVACNFVTGCVAGNAHVIGVTQGSGESALIDSEARAIKSQEEVLQRFRSRDLNVLIATNIIDDGVDVPRCNLVIRFSLPCNYKAYIQSKGRARARDSRYVMMVDANDCISFKKELRDFQAIESILFESCQDKQSLTEQEIDKEIVDNQYEQFVVEKTGAVLTMTNAIQFVNRYCSKLPGDSFTSLTPRWTLEKVISEDVLEYSALLKLPINSPVNCSISGKVMSNRTLAKMSVAFEACKILHMKKELNDYFIPVGKQVLSSHDEEEGEGSTVPQIGTNKRMRYYKIHLASCLTNCMPVIGGKCYLYQFSTRLVCPLPEPYMKGRYYDRPELVPVSVGILTAKELPSIPRFPLFTRSGEIVVEICLISENVSLSTSKLSKIISFHKYVFEEVLKLTEPPHLLHFSTVHSSFNPLVVPVKNEAIDFESIENIVNSRGNSANVSCNIGNFSKYADAVISPSYRNVDQPQRYFVAKIRRDLTPLHPFPQSSFSSYADYYDKKYNLTITDTNQPLLEAEYVNSRFNLLLCRHSMNDVHSENTLLGSREDKQVILVPELCNVSPVSGSLWRRIVCLPSIFYRLNSFEAMQELRSTISAEIKFGRIVPNCQYAPLCYKSVDVRSNSVANDDDVGPRLRDDTGTPSESDSNNGVFTLNKAICDLPVTMLTALTTCKAGDGFNLERLEMIGDSFLKQSTTIYLYCKYPEIHEGQLSKLRSNMVKNKNLFLKGRCKDLPSYLLSRGFDPSMNWSPPCYILKKDNEETWNSQSGQREGDAPAINIISINKSPIFDIGTWDSSMADAGFGLNSGDKKGSDCTGWDDQTVGASSGLLNQDQLEAIVNDVENLVCNEFDDETDLGDLEDSLSEEMLSKLRRDVSDDLANIKVPTKLETSPYTHHVVSDKTVADSVEALIGSFLITLGDEAAHRFMGWLGLEVTPVVIPQFKYKSMDTMNGFLQQNSVKEMYENYKMVTFEETIGYSFSGKSYLVQAFTHPSYQFNGVTDCYQRLEFLGDAVLDYLITRDLFDDADKYSPGTLTDLRSALVNNTIFASLAVKNHYHKYLMTLSLELSKRIDEFVHLLNKTGELQSLNYEAIDEDNLEEGPKPLGDIFESIAGAIYLDSGMDKSVVWTVYSAMMNDVIREYKLKIPKAPVRELLEMEPENTRFGLPQKTVENKFRVQVTVTGFGVFTGLGRNHRIAKAAAARKALMYIKSNDR